MILQFVTPPVKIDGSTVGCKACVVHLSRTLDSLVSIKRAQRSVNDLAGTLIAMQRGFRKRHHVVGQGFWRVV